MIAVLLAGMFIIWKITAINGCFLAETLLMIFLMKGKIIWRFAWLMELQSLLILCDALFFDFLIFGSKICGVKYDNALLAEGAVFIRLVFLVFLCLILRHWKQQISKVFQALSTGMSVYIIISISINLFLLGISQLYFRGIVLEKAMPVFAVSILLFGILQFMFCIMLQKVMDSQRQLKKLNQLKEECLRQQHIQYKELEKKNQDLRKFRHDYKEQIHVLNHLAQENQTERLKEYLADLSKKKDSLNHIYTGNVTADAVINRMYKMAQQKQISFEYKGKIPDEIPKLPDMILCSILSNALLNAVESAEKGEEEKKIWIEAGRDAQGSYLVIENTMRESEIKNGRLISQKKDSANHGIGMENIREGMEQCGGTMDWRAEGHRFKLFLGFLSGETDQI